MGRKGKLSADNLETPYLYRTVSIGREESRDEDRSLPIILATEDPVEAYDFSRMAVVDEILHFDGMDIPRQVPLVDTHDRGTVRNVLGSIRDLRVENNQLIGRAYFAADADAQRVYQNYRDGHLTDFSVGASVREVEYRGEEKHILRSVLREGSAVVAGQDPGAKILVDALRAYSDPSLMQDEMMRKQVRELLIRAGMDADTDDAGAVEFLDSIINRNDEESGATVAPVVEEETEPEDEATAAESEDAPETDEGTEDMDAATNADATAAAVAAERSRVEQITDICRNAGAADEKRRDFISRGISPEQAAAELLREMRPPTGKAGETGSPRIEGGISEREKFYAAAESGILQRMSDSGQVNPAAVLNRTNADRHAIQRSRSLAERLDKPADGAQDFRFVRLPDLAREFLERSGERVYGLPQTEIVRRALQQRDFIARDAATHTTGSFTNLLLDAANKTLLAGYDEAEASYSAWVRQAPSAADFKQLHRIRFGELGDPEVVPENDAYKDKTTSDAKESYGVEKYGQIFSISFEAIVNDDLNAMTRIPQMQGAAMRRKINKVCYAVLTDNAALSDGVALFHASSHGANLDAAALAESALDTGFNVMMTQTGLSGSGTPLAIRPQFLIVPAALAATAHRLVGGNVVPTAAGSNVPLYGAGRVRPLDVIEEPQLDSSSTTAWYLAANSALVDTVEVTFLQGEESPVLTREDSFDTDTVRYKIRQTFAAKAIDYRGLYQGNS